MNITPEELEAQYHHAKAVCGDLIDRVERDFDLPQFSLYAIGSRETNFNDYYRTHAGDEGHGRGWWQVDDRSHEIPEDWASDLEWQATTGADIFSDCLGYAEDDFVAAANVYNSGQTKTQYTTGKDYGPDVAERRDYLVSKFGSEEIGEDDMGFQVYNVFPGETTIIVLPSVNSEVLPAKKRGVSFAAPQGPVACRLVIGPRWAPLFNGSHEQGFQVKDRIGVLIDDDQEVIEVSNYDKTESLGVLIEASFR